MRSRSPSSISTSIGVVALGLAVALALATGAARFSPTAALLATDEIPGGTTPIDSDLVAAARALGRANAALERGDFASAEQSLSGAQAATPLADYVDLFEARLLLARGLHAEAAQAARLGSSAYARSPAAGAFTQLLGDALLASGDEAGARQAWQDALGQPSTRGRDDELRTAILASHARTGTLRAAIASDEAPAIPISGEAIVPPSLEASLRPPEASLRRADELMRAGHSAEAIVAYEAALSGRTGKLPEAARRRAELQRGHARFRLRRYSEAIESFAALLPDPEARFWHTRAVARSGNPQAAIRSFEAIAAKGDPAYANWSLYLAGTLLEDAGERDRAMALYRRVAAAEPSSARGLDALWRVGWASYRQKNFAAAGDAFRELATRSEGIDTLRPRYWGARAGDQAGRVAEAREQFARLAGEYPLSYYGWRASQRLGIEPGSGATPQTPEARPTARIPRGKSQIGERQKLRVALLLEAQLAGFAQAELGTIVARARSLEDRTSLGRLYARTGDYHRAQRLVVDAYAEVLSRGLQPGNEALWWLSWPPAYLEILMQVFPANAVIDPALVWAIMREESGYRPWITSSAGARGLLQIMPETAHRLANRHGLPDFQPDDLYVPEVNIALGSAYLDELQRRFPSRISAAIGSYNAGPRAVSEWLRGDRAKLEDDAWVEEIPYRQTRTYVKRVLRSLLVYRTFYATRAPGA